MGHPLESSPDDEDAPAEQVINAETIHFRLVDHARDILITEHISARLGEQLDPRDAEFIEKLIKVCLETLTPEEQVEARLMAEEQVSQRLPLDPVRLTEAEQLRDDLIN
jgi:hypothetical protein